MWRWEVAKFLTFAQIPLLRDPWPFRLPKRQERVTVGRVVPGVSPFNIKVGEVSSIFF